jgi:hypothetical protein
MFSKPKLHSRFTLAAATALAAVPATVVHAADGPALKSYNAVGAFAPLRRPSGSRQSASGSPGLRAQAPGGAPIVGLCS